MSRGAATPSVHPLRLSEVVFGVLSALVALALTVALFGPAPQTHDQAPQSSPAQGSVTSPTGSDGAPADTLGDGSPDTLETALASHTSRGTSHSQWAWFHPVWRGMNNDLVAFAQSVLNRFGYFAHLGPYGCPTSFAGAVDGHFDWCTEAAWDLFLRHHTSNPPDPSIIGRWGLLQGHMNEHRHSFIEHCWGGTAAQTGQCSYKDRHNHHPRPYTAYVYSSRHATGPPFYYYFWDFSQSCWVQARLTTSGQSCQWSY